MLPARAPPRAAASGVVDGWIVGGDGAGRVMPVDELAIPGRHNVSNALAAVAVGLLFGVAPDAIRRAAAAFRGVEHRLETVAEVDGVRFVNDSQGTQPDAVIAALRGVRAADRADRRRPRQGRRPVRARRRRRGAGRRGGPDRRERPDARGAVPRRRPRARPTGRRPSRRPSAAADAIARDAASPAGAPGPATVLLSPAAASFDMFVDYAARGRAFKEAVGAIAAERRAQEDDER